MKGTENTLNIVVELIPHSFGKFDGVLLGVDVGTGYDIVEPEAKTYLPKHKFCGLGVKVEVGVTDCVGDTVGVGLTKQSNTASKLNTLQ